MEADVKKVNRALEYISSHYVEIGVLGDGGTINANGDSEKEETVLSYAIAHEFGTKNIPPRPFISHALTSNRKQIEKYTENLMNDILSGKLDGRPATIKLGLYIQGLVVQSIATANTWATPLSPGYKEQKKETAPNRANQILIHDGFMIKSIRYKIVKGESTVFKSDWAKVGG